MRKEDKAVLAVLLQEQKLALKQRTYLFWFITGIVTASLFFTGLANGYAIIRGSKVDKATIISMTAAMAVQSFLLVRILAVSLYPPSKNSPTKKSTVEDDEVE